jgi:BirA family transcriptional regulator, biotin operon repressor / biotin---[acetyl-CoA-carboxylase] ligase
MKLKRFNFKIVNSTNSTAINIIKKTDNKFGFISANQQKKGKGTYGKKWISYNGNLFVTIFFTLDKVNLSLKQLTKANCLLIRKLLSYYYKKKILIKYPNDLLIKKKKISGILQENLKKYDENFLVVGIGINIVKSPKIKDYTTTSLYELTNKKFKKEIIEHKLKSIYEKFIPKLYRMNSNTINKI